MGGDLGIHAYILSKITRNKSIVVDIRNRVNAMDPLMLKNQFDSVIKNGPGLYQDSWFRNVKLKSFNGAATYLYDSLYSKEKIKEQGKRNDVGYCGDNFFPSKKKLHS